MTYKKRKQLEDLSMKAYGTTGQYKKIQRDGVLSDLETTENDVIRKYRGYKHPSDEEIEVVMQNVVIAKEDLAKKEAAELEVEQNRFANIPKPELKTPNLKIEV